MERFIRDVCVEISCAGSDPGINLSETDAKLPHSKIIERAVPIMRKWRQKLEKLDILQRLFDDLIAALRKRTVNQPKQSTKSVALTPRDVVKHVRELVSSEDYLVNAKDSYRYAEAFVKGSRGGTVQDRGALPASVRGEEHGWYFPQDERAVSIRQ